MSFDAGDDSCQGQRSNLATRTNSSHILLTAPSYRNEVHWHILEC
jgi:hypothetical protein